jgi:hypothetical protein
MGLFSTAGAVPANLPVGRDLTIRRKIEKRLVLLCFGPFESPSSNQGTTSCSTRAVLKPPPRRRCTKPFMRVRCQCGDQCRIRTEEKIAGCQPPPVSDPALRQMVRPIVKRHLDRLFDEAGTKRLLRSDTHLVHGPVVCLGGMSAAGGRRHTSAKQRGLAPGAARARTAVNAGEVPHGPPAPHSGPPCARRRAVSIGCWSPLLTPRLAASPIGRPTALCIDPTGSLPTCRHRATCACRCTSAVPWAEERSFGANLG